MDVKAVVIDNGSGVFKAGFSGENEPLCQIPSIMGTPKSMRRNMSGEQPKDCYFGEEAISRKCILNLKAPITNGITTNWDDIETFWDHIIHRQLKIVPQEHPFLLTEAPLNPKYHREKMTKIMFENFGVPGLYVCDQSLLALYAAGRTTGLVVNSGDGVTYTVPIYEGYPFPNSVRRLNVAGRELTQYFKQLLLELDYTIFKNYEMETVRKLKEEVCFVADYSKEIDAVRKCVLPDDREVTLNQERFRCAEALFDPSLVGVESIGIGGCVVESIANCSIQVQRELAGNILLSGGTTMLPGFRERLRRDVQSYFTEMEVKVIGVPDRKTTVWLGGSILAERSDFKNMWITKQEYYEYGPEIVHRKCI